MVELLLVVIILAVVAGLAIPNFSRSYVRLKLTQTAHQLSYGMRYAQSRAIRQNLQHKLVFDTNFKQYVLQTQAAVGESDFKRISGRWGRMFIIPTEIELQSPQHEVNFFPDGKIDRLRMYLCQKDQCLTVSTKEQQGYVDVFNERL